MCAIWCARASPVHARHPQGTIDPPACPLARSPSRLVARSLARPPAHSPTCLPQYAQKASQSELPFSRARTLACPIRPAPAMVPPSVFPPESTRAHVRPPARPLYRCPLARPECTQSKIKWCKRHGKKAQEGGGSAVSSFNRRGVWYARPGAPVVPEHRWPVAVAEASGHYSSRSDERAGRGGLGGGWVGGWAGRVGRAGRAGGRAGACGRAGVRACGRTGVRACSALDRPTRAGTEDEGHVGGGGGSYFIERHYFIQFHLYTIIISIFIWVIEYCRYLVRSMGRTDRPDVLTSRSAVEGGVESVKLP